MECDKVKNLLPGYLDGALPSGAGSDTHLMIGHHLELCVRMPRRTAGLSGIVVI